MGRRASTSTRALFGLTPYEYDVVLRNSLPAFIERSFAHLDPQTTYAPNWHIDLLADRLAQVATGQCRRLIINVPPRSLKSICASIAFPAWVLGHFPAKRIICASYGQDLANKLARDTHGLMTSDWYKRIFATRLTPHRSPIADFETTERGGRMATSVGGVLTGRGGDIVIIDDPVKPDEALSDSQRQAANDWFDNTLYSRLNNKATGAIVIIMQRLHLDDLVGHVLEKEAWDVVCLPAIASEPELWRYHVPLIGQVRHARQPGEALHAIHEPLSSLAATRSNVGEYVFSAQYQQAPVPMGGGLVKRAWLRYYTPDQLPKKFDRTVQSWDTANKVSELSDFSVCTTWGVKGKDMYLLHVLRKRMEYPELRSTAIAHRNAWQADKVLIEDKASGTQLVQELKGMSYRFTGVRCMDDKVMRLLAQTPAIESGKVHFPESAGWLPEFEAELLTFPMGKYDDQVDSMAQAIKWIDEYQEPVRDLRIRWAC